ncbi:MAG TPA: lytic transglycosylase domain-containing protein [Thermotogota bacterium]|nr:lytic transglycosylase domain-containing protein [Thermotogota bacterium]HPJ87479.1 lytic transglycosylase domain-containing protein [Thermotogota bacterium]HPR94684.1 lytic transglycosylase domain-containing protein [Thermotogota bacterium]
MTFGFRKTVFTSLFIIIIFLFVLLILLYRYFPVAYICEINKASRENELEPALVAATIKMESGFNERAVSSSGAFGLMQLMPDTAEWLYEKNIISGNWRDPEQNIMMGTYYLKTLINRFEDLELALNGYHKGPNKIQRMIDTGEAFDKTYSERIMIYRLIYNLLYHDFFTDTITY